MKQLKEREDEKIYLYGVSYGSYWANRFLQMYPNFLDSVVLDGIAPPQMLEFVFYDRAANQVGLRTMEQCKLNPTCKDKINEPSLTIENAFKHLEERNHCKEGIENLTSEKLRRTFFQFLAKTQEKVLILPILYRINRCNNQDIIILKHFQNSIEKM